MGRGVNVIIWLLTIIKIFRENINNNINQVRLFRMTSLHSTYTCCTSVYAAVNTLVNVTTPRSITNTSVSSTANTLVNVTTPGSINNTSWLAYRRVHVWCRCLAKWCGVVCECSAVCSLCEIMQKNGVVVFICLNTFFLVFWICKVMSH